MKNTFKYLLVLAAAAAFGLAGCQKEEADVQGVTGSLAYIVDGTQAEYVAPTLEVYHTPNGSFGNVKREVVLSLTKPQTKAVELTLALDNSSLSEGYAAFPEGSVKFDKTVKIPAGETSVSVYMSVPLSELSKLTEAKYQAVLRIASAKGVNVSTNSNASYMMASTGESNIDPTTNVVNLTGSENTYGVKHYLDGSKASVVSKDITVTGTESALIEFDVNFTVDNSLVAAYNEANGTEYLPLPEGVKVQVKPATMAKNSKSATTTVSIAKDEMIANLTDDKGYLVPLVIGDAGFAQINENSGVTYLKINVAHFDETLSYFSALYLGDHRMATWYKFPEAWSFQYQYTYIFNVYIDEVTNKSRIGNFSDANEKWINMLRFGEKGDKDTRLEWWVGPGSYRYKVYSPALEPGKWYQIALVYYSASNSNTTFTMYVNGEQAAQQKASSSYARQMRSSSNLPKFQAIEFNSSWDIDYREGNEFHGRLWNVGVWNRSLSVEEINKCIGGIDLFVNPDLAAGCAFWGFDDGQGAVVRQKGGDHQMGDIDFTKTTRVDDESTSAYVDADVSEYIRWVSDENNNFD